MTTSFEVEVKKIQLLQEVPLSWTKEQFQSILEECEADDIHGIADEEIKDYALMALQDLKPDEAAEVLLKVKLGDRLSIGQIDNLAQEMQEEPTWEEYGDLSCHEKLYHCASILHEAFPKNTPEAKAVLCTLTINPQSPYSAKALANLDESMVTRLLADGTSDHSILNRFFKDKLIKGPFKEAEHIVWQYDLAQSESIPLTVQLYTSRYWLGDIHQGQVYTSDAFSDQSSN